MFDSIIENFSGHLGQRLSEIFEAFQKNLDAEFLENALNEELANFNAELQLPMLESVLTNPDFLAKAKVYAGTCGLRFKEYRYITVTLGNGKKIRIKSPYFVKAKPHHRRKKRGPNGTGAHIGLKILGFIGEVNPNLLTQALQAALLAPSYEVASTLLKGRGIILDVKALRRLCQLAGSLDIGARGQMSLTGEEKLNGYTLVIGIDGGRLRQRLRKRGRKAEDLKRQGYSAEWKEPKLFTIYLVDDKGGIVKDFKPLHDATMGDHTALFDLLECYLDNLDLTQLDRIVFCGDGAKWIWNGIEKLCKRKDLDETKVFQVLDYTHAKQNLQKIVSLVKANKQASAMKKWKELLWHGKIAELKQSIIETITHKSHRESALNKFADFFESNAKRMQYARFTEYDLPTGSGHVESAIRRVINLRLKAPGTFWLKEMAECFLYLRSQLISGRWNIFMSNLTSQIRRAFQACFTADILPSKSVNAA